MKMTGNAIDALIYLGVLMANGDKIAEKAYKELDSSLSNQPLDISHVRN